MGIQTNKDIDKPVIKMGFEDQTYTNLGKCWFKSGLEATDDFGGQWILNILVRSSHQGQHSLDTDYSDAQIQIALLGKGFL